LGIQLIQHLETVRPWVEKSKRRLATTGVVLLVVTVAYHVIFGANGMLVYAKKRSEYRKLEQEIQMLQQDNERLQQRIKALRTDPKAIEKEAREQLRYARPGEVIYTVPEEKLRQQHSAEKR
jgi:cell division protein FtsB